MKVYIVRLIDKGVKLETVYRVQKITIAPLKKGLSLNFTLWKTQNAAVPNNKTITANEWVHTPFWKVFILGRLEWM